MTRTLLTVAQVAERIGVRHETILKYIRGGKIVAVALPSSSKFGIRYRVSPDEVAAFIGRQSTLPRRTEAPTIVGPRAADPASHPPKAESLAAP